jgi:phage host-nuclease inhibitor protein Gam
MNQDKKICSKCSQFVLLSSFGKSSGTKDGLRYECNSCRKKYNLENRDSINSKKRKYWETNRESLLCAKKTYYETNKDNITAIRTKQTKYYIKNADKIKNKVKEYSLNNKDLIAKSGKIKRNSKANFTTYEFNLTVDEKAKLSEDGISLEVVCKYCGKYFIPTIKAVQHRLGALSGTDRGDNFLYCSEGCKTACPIYGQVKYPKGFKKASSREVNPLVRQMCFERDNWECQICGETQEDTPLHCHHIEGYAQNPRLGNDVANTITLCKTCHKEIHKLPGCSYSDLRCEKNDI